MDDFRQLKRYALYATGSPLAITAISAGIEFLPETSIEILRPEFGKWRCFFSDPMSTFVYLYLPIVVVQTSNLVFFVMTANNLRETWNLTRHQLFRTTL